MQRSLSNEKRSPLENFFHTKSFGEKLHEVVYEPVVKKDLKDISLEQQKILAKEIQKKLAIAPHIYGKPLRNVLHPWRSLRIGKYRVVFDIQEMKVVVWAIIPRKKGYEEIQKRR